MVKWFSFVIIGTQRMIVTSYWKEEKIKSILCLINISQSEKVTLARKVELVLLCKKCVDKKMYLVAFPMLGPTISIHTSQVTTIETLHAKLMYCLTAGNLSKLQSHDDVTKWRNKTFFICNFRYLNESVGCLSKFINLFLSI